MSVWEGMRLLQGAPGTAVTLVVLRGNAAEPHEVDADARGAAGAAAGGADAPVEDRLPARGGVRGGHAGRAAAGGRAVAGRGREGADPRPARLGARPARGRASRRRARSSPAARWRSSSRAARAARTISAAAGDGAITLPVAVLTDFGTAGRGRTVRRRAGRQQARRDRRRTHGRPCGPAAAVPAARWRQRCGCPTRGTSHRPAPPFTSGGFSRTSPVAQPDVEFGAPVPDGDSTLEQGRRAPRQPHRVVTCVRQVAEST